MARKTIDQLEPMEVLSPADVEDSADFCTEFVTLEEAEGYAVEFAKAILFGYGFTEEAIESTVNGYANDMWLKQHPSRSPWKFGLEGWLSEQEKGGEE